MEVCEKKYPKTDTIGMYTKKHSISKFRQIFMASSGQKTEVYARSIGFPVSVLPFSLEQIVSIVIRCPVDGCHYTS